TSYPVPLSIWLSSLQNRKTAAQPIVKHCQKNGGPETRRSFFRGFRLFQRRSCRTLCCDWLASASADTAIDWRVASAWLLAASSLVSASVRFAEPVCRTLIRFLEKS